MGREKIILGVAVTIVAVFIVAYYISTPIRGYNEGDKWTYSVSICGEENIITLEVVNVERDKIKVKEASKKTNRYNIYTYKKGYMLYERYNKEGELLSEDEYQGDPYFVFEFFTPSLNVGQRWEGTFELEYTDKNGTVRETQLTFEGKILEKEKITVEAGQFETYHVKIQWNENEMTWGIWEYWYAPEIRYNAKFTSSPGGDGCKVLAELKDAELV